MTTALATASLGGLSLPEQVEKALIGGDLAPLSVEHRIAYYNALCKSLGLNPLSKPFNYLSLNGKLVLYAAKDCTDQLRATRGVSVTDLDGRVVDDLYVVVAKGRDKDGRSDAATGAVPFGKLFGEAKANAIMKAETKAKRRLTLSLCGLGMMDESEVASVVDAKPVAQDYMATAVTGAKPEPVQVKAEVVETPKTAAPTQAPATPKPTPTPAPAKQASAVDLGAWLGKAEDEVELAAIWADVLKQQAALGSKAMLELSKMRTARLADLKGGK